MKQFAKWLNSQKPIIKNITLLLSGVLIGVVATAIFNPGNIRNKALDSLGLSTKTPSQVEQVSTDVSTSPSRTITKDENDPNGTTTTVTNPKKTSDNISQSSSSNNNTGGGDNSNSGSSSSPTPAPTPTPPACVWHTYTGAELTSGVRAQIGQLITFTGASGYVSAVSYSESNGQKVNIKYGVEKYGSYVPESSVLSVSGVSGFYTVGGDPIQITDKPAYCPAQQ